MAGSIGYNTRAYVSNAPGAFAIVILPTDARGGGGATAQDPLPSIAANATADYFMKVGNEGAQWKVGKTVNYMHSDGLAETAGIIFGGLDCVAPVYPGSGVVVATGAYAVLNGYLFKATTGGTTAVKFIGFSNFKTVKGATTTDGSVVWTSFSKAALIRVRYANVTSAGPLTPVAQMWELFQD
jgi:hypothetical protein